MGRCLGLALSLLAVAADAMLSKSKHSADEQHPGDAPAGSIDHGSSFVRSLSFQQRLRICNAYPYFTALGVLVGEKSLTQSPLKYKGCQEFLPSLRIGDRINFMVDANTVGTFTITELPENDAVLLMVIYRHDADSTAVAFQSHVFSNQRAAQIAILDTYKGAAKSELRIRDALPKRSNRSELLRYDSVVAVDPGDYAVQLNVGAPGANASAISEATLEAKPGESYVVIRCGVEARVGEAYPQSLLVFPPGPPEGSLQQSGAHGAALSRGGVLAVVSALALLVSLASP